MADTLQTGQRWIGRRRVRSFAGYHIYNACFAICKQRSVQRRRLTTMASGTTMDIGRAPPRGSFEAAIVDK